MTTVQSKPKIDRKQKTSSLGWFVLLSVIAHGLGVWLWSLKVRSPLPSVEPQASTPIDFVVVPPEETPIEPPPETKRIATNDSVSKGEVKPELPPQSDLVAPSSAPAQPNVEPQSQIVETPTPSEVTQSEQPVNKKIEPEIKPPPEVTKPTQKTKTPETDDLRIEKPTEIAPSQLDKTAPAATSTESTIATNSAPPKPQPKESLSSGAASLLGTESRSLAKDSDEFFLSKSENASQQALNSGGIDARRDPNFATYFAEIRRRVRRNWQPSSPGEDKQTVVAFAIQRNGQITDLRVTQSSGSPEVDRESLAAIQNAAPFSALPADFPEPQLDVEFNFNIYIHPSHWQRGLNNW